MLNSNVLEENNLQNSTKHPIKSTPTITPKRKKTLKTASKEKTNSSKGSFEKPIHKIKKND